MTFRRQRLTQRRRMLGLSQQQLAERVGVDRSTVVRWERGESAPHPWHRPRMARVLKITAEELDDLLLDRSPEDSPHAERVEHALAHPAGIDLVSVAFLREQVGKLGAAYDTAPSAALLADAGQCLSQIGFFRQNAASSQVRRELTLAEAEAATLMGKLVWDASGRRDQRTPLAFLDQAVIAAGQVGDKTAQGHALLRKSYLALYGSRDPGNGRRLASAAAETARQASNAVTGLALLHAAEGCAMRGERRSCGRCLAQAEALLNQVAEIDTAAGLFTLVHYRRLAGSCYLYLRDAGRAQQLLESAARDLASGTKSQAIILGNLALACIRQRNLDEAVAHLDRAITVIEQTWGGGGLTVVFAAGQELRPWRAEPVVQDTYDRLLGLMAAA
jgi:transcriptional regulator with XRE-family HTH domain